MIILLMLVLTVQAAVLRGTVTDKATKEPLIGAAVQLSGTNTGTITDVDGNFELAGLRNGTYKLIISYVSYCTQTVEVTISGMFEIKVELEQDNQQLGEVVVVADAKKNTENAIITQQRTSLVMQTGVSAQQITKTQDKDASEVIRRVPGRSPLRSAFYIPKPAAPFGHFCPLLFHQFNGLFARKVHHIDGHNAGCAAAVHFMSLVFLRLVRRIFLYQGAQHGKPAGLGWGPMGAQFLGTISTTPY